MLITINKCYEFLNKNQIIDFHDNILLYNRDCPTLKF